MIQSQTHLNVVDNTNSGAWQLMYIQIIGASTRWYAHIVS